jgi:2-dehydropantoate 2-reductase
MGSGGLGGFYGGLLARAGEDVTLIARGAHLDAIRAHGLRVRSEVVGDFEVKVPVTADPAEVGPVDLVIVAVKTYDLDIAAAEMRPLVRAQTVVLPLENGIDARERLAGALGEAPIATGIAYVSAFIESPGAIRHTALNRIILGDSAGPTPRIMRIAEAFQRAGIACETPDDIEVPLWEKFILLTGTGGVMALTRLACGPIRECEETAAFFRGALQEAHAVGRAKGIRLADDVVKRHWSMILGLPAAAHGSMLQDLQAGRRLELESLNGSVVRMGRTLGVPTPLNFAVYAGLKPYIGGSPTG